MGPSQFSHWNCWWYNASASPNLQQLRNPDLRTFADMCVFLRETCALFAGKLSACLLNSKQFWNFLGTFLAQNMGLLRFFFTNSGKIQFASTSITLSALVACHVLHQTSPSGRFVFSYLSLSRSTLFVNMQKLPSSMPRYVKSASFWQFNLVQVCFWAIGPIWTICGICGFLRSFAAKSPKVKKLLNFGRSRKH